MVMFYCNFVTTYTKALVCTYKTLNILFTADPGFLQRQVELWYLFFHVHEPTFVEEQKTIVGSWDIEKNIELYSVCRFLGWNKMLWINNIF